MIQKKEKEEEEEEEGDDLIYAICLSRFLLFMLKYVFAKEEAPPKHSLDRYHPKS